MGQSQILIPRQFEWIQDLSFVSFVFLDVLQLEDEGQMYSYIIIFVLSNVGPPRVFWNVFHS